MLLVLNSSFSAWCSYSHMFCFNLCQDAFRISTLRPGINHGQKSTWNLSKRSPAGRNFRVFSFIYFQNLRWGCDQALGDRITCYNRHFAENFGYWLDTDFYDYAIKQVGPFFNLTAKSENHNPNLMNI